MTLPTVNPTTPSEPRNLAVTPLSGAINGTWLPPIVRVYGTRFEVIAATNCADASVGTVAWSGDALSVNVPWTNADSLTFWWVRAVANSGGYSPFEPNTFGLLAIPARAPDNTLLSRPVPDPNFTAGITVGSYWSFGPFPASCGSLHRSGGINDGSGMVTANGSTNTALWQLSPDHRSIPGNRHNAGDHPVSPGQRVTLQVGVRRTTTIAGSGGLAGFGLQLGFSKTVGAVNYDIQNGVFIRVDTLTVNEWTYISHGASVPNSGWDKVSIGIGVGPANLSSGTIQFGRFDCTITNS